VVAPLVFRGIYEYHLLLGVTWVLVCSVVARDLLEFRPAKDSPAFARIAGGIGWAGFVVAVAVLTTMFLDRDRWPADLQLFGSGVGLQAILTGCRVLVVLTPLLVLVVCAHLRRLEFREAWRSRKMVAQFCILCAVAVSIVPLSGALAFEVLIDQDRDNVLDRARNFYGVLTVEEYDREGADHEVDLVHGRIQHGLQRRAGGRQKWPTSYYGPESGVGLAIRKHPERGREGRQFRIGVVGLGAGTLAAYGNTRVERNNQRGDYVTPVRRTPGDYLAFYEINPLVADWAILHFTFIEDAALRGAEVSLRTGDARIVLERELSEERPGRFDVLAVDAFSSDAIPVHLLTRECFAIYDRHLAENGILAIHITNRYLRLAPVVHRVATELGFLAVYIENQDDSELSIDGSDWILLTRSRSFVADPDVEAARSPLGPPGPLWTDDFSSIIPLLK